MAPKQVLVLALVGLWAVHANAAARVSVAQGFSVEDAYVTIGTILTSLSASSGGRRLAASPTADTAAALLQQLGQFQGGDSRAGGRAVVPTAAYLVQITAFLAQDTTGAALGVLLASDKALQALKPAQSRAEACAEVKKGKWPSKVVDCYCTAAMPWMHCDALSFVEFNAFVGQLASASPVLTTLEPTPLRRLLTNTTKEPASFECHALTDISKMIFESKHGCIGTAYCNVKLAEGAVKLHANITGGCFPDFKLIDTGSEAVAKWAKDGMPFTTEYTLKEAATTHQAGVTALADVGVDIHGQACIDIGFVNSILDFLNIGNCANAHANLHPVKSQVGMDVRLGQGKTYVGVKGKVQYLNHTANPICKLVPYDEKYWGCKSYCQYNAGNGHLTVHYGVSAFGLVHEKTHEVLNTKLACHS